MKRVISCVLLMLVLTSNAFALEVPTDTVVQNLNGSQQAIKTFTVSPEQDPAALIEEPFELEGYLYTFADIVKSENPVEEKRIHTEVITVETTKDDLALILEQLKPTIEYDDGRFQGTLALDHTSLNTVAAGYATKNYRNKGDWQPGPQRYVLCPRDNHQERQNPEPCQCGVAGHRHRSCG